LTPSENMPVTAISWHSVHVSLSALQSVPV